MDKCPNLASQLESLRTQLRPRLNLKSNPDIRITLIGVGSDLRSDDGAGVRVIERLLDYPGIDGNPRLQLLVGGNAPENVTGAIIKYAPTHLIVVDAASFGADPGSVRLIAPKAIEGVTFSSHMMPLSVVLSYLGQYIKTENLVIGIQPVTTEFGFDMTPPVEHSVDEVVRTVAALLLD